MKDGTDRSASIRPIGSWLLRLLASMGVVMAILSCQTPIAFAAECGEWTPVDGERDFVPAYPDTHTQYWVWSFARTRRSMTTAFRIKGQFPYARYMSFQTYSSTQGDALQDFQIVPDSGSVNPFQPQIDRSAVTRSYTVWFVPPNSMRHQNSIEMPSDTSSLNLVLASSGPIRIGQTEGCRSPRSKPSMTEPDNRLHVRRGAGWLVCLRSPEKCHRSRRQKIPSASTM